MKNKNKFRILASLTGIEYICTGIMLCLGEYLIVALAVFSALLFHWYSIKIATRYIR